MGNLGIWTALREVFPSSEEQRCWNHRVPGRAHSWEVLWVAWYRVRRNRGVPGVDGRTIRAIQAEGEMRFLKEIQTELCEKRYRPKPVRRKFILKENGKLRPLGIPVVKDRVIQGAVKIVLEPVFEANFLDTSYGFRPGKGCRDAIWAIRKWVTFGYRHVIDAGIAAYFDRIDHDLLMQLVQRRVRDKWILRLIRWWLKAGILEEGQVRKPVRGTPQGGSRRLQQCCKTGGRILFWDSA